MAEGDKGHGHRHSAEAPKVSVTRCSEHFQGQGKPAEEVPISQGQCRGEQDRDQQAFPGCFSRFGAQPCWLHRVPRMSVLLSCGKVTDVETTAFER